MDPTVLQGYIDILHVAVVALVGLSLLLWITPGACVCDKCVVHSQERRVSREKARAQRHRDHHQWSRTPWGSKRCPDCASGHKQDEMG